MNILSHPINAPRGTTSTVALPADVLVSHAAEWMPRLLQCIGDGVTLTVDAGQVTAFDLALVQGLLVVKQELRARGGELVLAACSTELRAALELAGASACLSAVGNA